MKKTSLIILFALMLILPRYAHADITTGLVHEWTMNQTSGTTVSDSGSNPISMDWSANTYSACLTNMGWTTGNIFANSMYYDATDCGAHDMEVVPSANISELDSTQNFTLSMWINPSSEGAGVPNGFSMFFKNQASFDGTHDLLLYSSPSGGGNSGNIQMQVDNGVDGGCYFTDPNFYGGTWKQIIVIYDGTQSTNATRMVMYENGVKQTLSCEYTVPSSSANYGSARQSGTTDYGYFGGGQFNYSGLMEDVRIYNRSLSSSDATQLYYYPNPVPVTSFLNELEVALGKSLSIRLGHSFTVK